MMKPRVTLLLDDYDYLRDVKKQRDEILKVLKNCLVMENGEHWSWANRSGTVVGIEFTNDLKKLMFDLFDDDEYFKFDEKLYDKIHECEVTT